MSTPPTNSPSTRSPGRARTVVSSPAPKRIRTAACVAPSSGTTSCSAAARRPAMSAPIFPCRESAAAAVGTTPAWRRPTQSRGRRAPQAASTGSAQAAPAAATSTSGTAPPRRIRTGSTVQSTTVEAGPPWAGPPSTMQSTASPSCAAISAASRAGGRPDRLADVTGSGPTAAASARGTGVVGHPQPDRRAPGGELRRQVRAGQLVDDDRQAARPERAGERGGGRRPGRDGSRLVGVVEEQHDRPVRRAAASPRTARSIPRSASSATPMP